MNLGKHVSIIGGIDNAPERAKDIGCNCFQIFVKNPRGWKGKELKKQEIINFQEKIKDLNMGDVVVHSTYLINLASPNDKLWEKSIKGLKNDYVRSGKILANYLVLHPGSHTGSGIEQGVKRTSKAINRVLSEIDNDTIILLENVSGAGTTIGSNFTEIHDIIEGIEHKERIGLCLDTCHVFAAGYDLCSNEGINILLDEINREIGLERLKVIHINDSKHDLGTNKDEHAHIGEGYIGMDGFEKIINNSRLKNLTYILETADFDGEDEDIKRLLLLRNE